MGAVVPPNITKNGSKGNGMKLLSFMYMVTVVLIKQSVFYLAFLLVSCLLWQAGAVFCTLPSAAALSIVVSWVWLEGGAEEGLRNLGTCDSIEGNIP
jgi:hypothetical protein